MLSDTKIVMFNQNTIRRTFRNDQWWFAVADVIAVLTNSPNPTDYIKKIRSRDKELARGWGQFVTPLWLDTEGGKQKVNCANTEALLRIIQSVPSPKAEPFKRWLAKVGYERIQEIEDPELATARTRDLYKAKGYSDAWIEKRLRGIAIRDELTEEWKKRDVQEARNFAILTAEISKATFGMSPSEYQQHKGLNRENLRDHMTDLELIFSMLGEASTIEIARNRDAKGFEENRKAAKVGGKVAGDARTQLEKASGQKVITKSNYLPSTKKLKENS